MSGKEFSLEVPVRLAIPARFGILTETGFAVGTGETDDSLETPSVNQILFKETHRKLLSYYLNRQKYNEKLTKASCKGRYRVLKEHPEQIS